MRAGKLRTKVTFQKEAKNPDGSGGFSHSWGEDKSVFCQFISQSGRESLEASRIADQARATLSARSKSVSFLDASWSAMIGGVRWNILSVTPFGQRDERTDIVIERGVAN